MRNTGIAIAFALLTPLAACNTSKKAGGSSKKMPGNWQAQPITIDGDSKDWPSPYPTYDSKSKVAYATSNDGKYLYITVETGDEFTQVKMLRAGMTVSIDTGGGKDAQFHINYPLQNDNDEQLEMSPALKTDKSMGHIEKTLTRQIKKMMGNATQLSLDGFGGCNGGYSIGQTTPCGVKVKAAMDEYNELVWEAAIPLKTLYNKETITSTDAGKPISVCFEVKGIKKPKTTSNPDQGMGNSSGMGGMNSGMGGRNGRAGQATMGGRGHAMAENPMDQMYTTTRTWKQFGLAVQ